MFTIKTNQKAKVDKDGRKYILHPITKEKLYKVEMPLIDNKCVDVQPMTAPVGLAFVKRYTKEV